ncbi:MAG: GNAT family N-acetyltransferase [Salinirussus sp.]
MTVRRGQPADLPRLRAIQAAAVAEPWPELLAARQPGPIELFVAVDGRPVGYATVVAPGGVAYLPELAVAPGRQGEGFGTALLDAVAAAVGADHAELRLTVRATDHRVQSFYDDRGFERLDRLPDHFEAGDGYLLRRALRGSAGQ